MALAEELGRALWFVALDDDPGWRDQLQEMFTASADLRMAGATANEADVPRLVADNGADLVLVDHGLAGRSGLTAAANLTRKLPSVRVYLMSEAPTRELWDEARRRGVRGVVAKPFTAEALARRVHEDMEMDHRVTSGLTTAPSGGEAAKTGAFDAPRTVAVMGFKGGVGKTLVAVSLALAASSPLSRRRREVVLVDAEEGMGSTATILGVPMRPTIQDWAEYRGEQQMDPAIARHKLGQTKGGLYCLFSPGQMDQGVGGDLMATVLGTLPRMFGLVVVDCAPTVTEAVWAALTAATTVVVMVEPTLDGLRRTAKGLDGLRHAGMPISKYKLLVNAARPGAGSYSAAEVREAVGAPVLGALPFDPGTIRAVNRGRPLAVAEPWGGFMTALYRAMDGVVPALGPGGKRRWWGGVGR